MKKTKRIVSSLIAGMLAITSFAGFSVSAAGNNTGSITINLPEGVSVVAPKATPEVKKQNSINLASAVEALQNSTSPLASVPGTVIEDGKTPDTDDMDFKAYQVFKLDTGTTDTDKLYVVTDAFKPFFADLLTSWDKTATTAYIGVENNKLKLYSAAGTGRISVTPANITAVMTEERYFEAIVLKELMKTESNKATVAGWLKDFAENAAESDKLTAVSATWKSVADGKLVFDNLAYGYWLVYSTNVPNGVSNVEAILEIGKNQENQDITVKAEYDVLTKQVRNVTRSIGAFNAETPNTSTTATVGDIVEYQVTFDIQDLTKYDETSGVYKYTITDVMKNQALVNYTTNTTYATGTSADDTKGAFVIEFTKADGTALKTYKDLADAGEDDELSDILDTTAKISYGTYDSGQQTFVINLDLKKIKTEVDTSYKGAYKVTLKYMAELMDEAITKNNNKVTLNYSNDPKGGASTNLTTHESEADVYSFGIDVTKKFSDSESTDPEFSYPTTDIKFSLFKASTEASTAVKSGSAIEFIRNSDGNYSVIDAADKAISSNVVTELVVAKNTDNKTGNLKLFGLTPGYYVLEEVLAPKGYAKSEPFVVYVDGTGNTIVTTGNHAWYCTSTTERTAQTVTKSTDSNREYIAFDVLNTKVDLNIPTTGGLGIWLAVIGGMSIITLGFVLFKRSSKNNVA